MSLITCIQTTSSLLDTFVDTPSNITKKICNTVSAWTKNRSPSFGKVRNSETAVTLIGVAVTVTFATNTLGTIRKQN